MSFFSFPSQQIYYCIENNNNENPLDEGKHNFVHEEHFTDFACEFCFLPKTKANFKPLVKLTNGKFRFLPKTDLTKKYFFEVDQNWPMKIILRIKRKLIKTSWNMYRFWVRGLG